MKKVIAFSLWGDKSFYCLGAILNADIAEKLFPDWICRYYISPNVPSSVVKELQSRQNVEILLMEEDSSWFGSFWRFYAAGDPEVSVMISRDADSRLNLRDKAAVDQWLTTDKNFHIMRDMCQHGWPIAAGMWGCKNGILLNIKEMIDYYVKFDSENNHGIDQRFLARMVYPSVVNQSLVNDDWFNFPNEYKKPYPIPRLRGYGWWEKNFPEWHSGIEDDYENYPFWQPPKGPGHCPLKCPDCGEFHDNEYIGKHRFPNDREKKNI